MSDSPSNRRRPLPSRTTHLMAQAAMPGTLNGDAAARELAQLGQPISPTAPAAEPSAELLADASATPTAPAPTVEPTPAATPTAPAVVAATTPADAPTPTELTEADADAADAPRAARSRVKNSTSVKDDKPAKNEKSADSSGSTSSFVRLSKEHTRDVKAAQLHYLLVHDTSITLQDFNANALDHYLAHLRKTGKLPPAKS